MTCSASPVFADWLDVTFSPDSSPLDDVRLWFDSLLCPVRYADDTCVVIDVGAGVLKLEYKPRFHRVSASGVVLAHLRSLGMFDEYLWLLASKPHKVTRLDAARDYFTDAPPFLRHLEAKYPNDRIRLQRKEINITRLYSARQSDGQQTGTWYAGHKSNARVTLRVYDKQAEALDKRGEILPPTTRVELTFRKDHGCTLRDAAMPYSLYHEFASPQIVPKPSDADPWSPHGEGWVSQPIEPALPFEQFRRRVETSPELDRLVELASSFGDDGRALLMRVFERRLRNTSKPSVDAPPVTAED